MNQPTQYPRTDAEWAAAFAPKMSPDGFDRLLSDLGYRGTPDEPTIQDLALLSDRAPDTRVAPCGHVIEPEAENASVMDNAGISLEAAESMRDEIECLENKLKRSESENTLIAALGLVLLVVLVAYIAWRGI